MKPTLAWALPLLAIACFPDPDKGLQEDETGDEVVDTEDDDGGDEDDSDEDEDDGDEDDGGSGDDGGGAGGGSGDDGGSSGSDDGGGSGGDDGGGSGGDSGGDDGGSSFEPCPTDVVCVDSFPFSERSTTVGAPFDDFDSYSCGSQNESGAEVVYRVDLDDDGFLAVDLPQSSMGSGADIDLHILETFDSGDCIDRGHWRAGTYLEAGSYWVVADTWVSGAGVEQDGSYEITMGFTSVGDMMSDGMDATVAEDALWAFDVAWAGGETDSFAYAVTDFSLHSRNKRQWVYDLSQNSLEWELYVAHGEGSSGTSNTGVADTFSNINNSHQSSLGMMRAAETYTGSYGYSVRLDGLESSYNGIVRSRYIVVHPWQGSRDTYVSSWGETAETWGCPAIDDRISDDCERSPEPAPIR